MAKLLYPASMSLDGFIAGSLLGRPYEQQPRVSGDAAFAAAFGRALPGP
jgi:hypothetical protein